MELNSKILKYVQVTKKKIREEKINKGGKANKSLNDNLKHKHIKN